jgi:hypothetical protein
MSNSGRRLGVLRQSHNFAEAVDYDDEMVNAVRNNLPGEKMTPVDLPVEYYKAAGEQAGKPTIFETVASWLRL